MVLEKNGGEVALFFPPLLQPAFIEMLEIVAPAVCMPQAGLFRFEGYIPDDTERLWTKLSFTPDPGVLEINLPPCATVQEYAWWLKTLARLRGARRPALLQIHRRRANSAPAAAITSSSAARRSMRTRSSAIRAG